MQEIKFVGRDAELDFLEKEWAAVRGGSGPRLVVWLADSGLGKTRLIQVFYERLAVSQGVDGYWPATISAGRNLSVNPDAGSCCSASSPIFLWWGIRLEDPGARNAIITSSLAGQIEILEPHVAPLVRAIRARANAERERHELTRKVGEKAIETAFEAIPVVGQALTLAKTGYELYGSVRKYLEARRVAGHAREPIGPKGEIEFARQNSVNVAVSTLRDTLSPSADMSSGLPTVMFIDDGQFSPDDQTCVEFVKQVLEEAYANSWPLLLVVTYWPREWHEHRRNEQGIAGAIFKSQDKGRLHPNWQPRELKPLDSDLIPLLRADLPGLTETQQRAFLNRVGGNPLLYVEMRDWFLSRRKLFVDRDVRSALTDEGADELREHAFSLHDLIRERLNSAPIHVQQALAIGSLQGIRFARTLTHEIATLLASQATERGIDEAALPHHFVEPNNQTIVEFTQRCVHEVSADIVADHFDRDDAQQALLDVIRRRLDDPNAGKRLGEDDFELTLRVAVALYIRLGVIADAS